MTDVVREIDGVRAIAMLDQSTDSGETSQVGYDWMALDKDGNVWILGGYTEDYEGGQFTNIEDAWLGKASGGVPGILLPGHVTMQTPRWFIGATEAGSAGSAGEPAELGVKRCVRLGCFTDVLVVREGEASAIDNELKYYAPGVGIVDNVPHGASLHRDTFQLLNVVGPSGSGKSTLLSLIAGLLRPDDGVVSINGASLAELDDAQRATLRANDVGIALQSENLIPFLTALENVELALSFARGRGGARNRANALLEQMQVTHRSGHLPRQLSGGEAQRVSLAVALANQPVLLLADEMASQLDSCTAGQVLDAVFETDMVEIPLHLAGLFDRLPGFPDGADTLMNIAPHEQAVPSVAPSFFLVGTVDGARTTLDRAVAALRAGPGAGDALQVDTRTTALAKDQSSLAALNIRGLLNVDSGYALAMGTVAEAIFVFGLLLQRRREYVPLRTVGLAARSIRALITAEAATVAIGGCICGVLVGIVMAFYFVNVLRPLFVLTPGVVMAAGPALGLVAAILAATLAASLGATSLVNRLQATELLRDE